MDDNNSAVVAVELEYIKAAFTEQKKNLRNLSEVVADKFDKQSKLHEEQARISMEFRHTTALELNKIQTRLGLLLTGAIAVLNYALPYVIKLITK